MRANMYYPMKVWATTLVIGALVFCLYAAFLSTSHTVSNDAWIMAYLLAVGVGALFSLPALGISYLYFIIMSNLHQSTGLLKLLMAVFNVLICFLTFYAIKLTDHHMVWSLNDILFVLCYVVPLLASVMFYKVRSAK